MIFFRFGLPLSVAFLGILVGQGWNIRFVSVQTSNGVNNQRESIINALLITKAINGTFLLPRVYPIWLRDAVGNSAGSLKWNSASYVTPWTGMITSGLKSYPFGYLFDVETLSTTVRSVQISVTSKLPPRNIKKINFRFYYKRYWYTGLRDLISKKAILSRLPSHVLLNFPSLLGLFRPTRPEHLHSKRFPGFGHVWYCNRTVLCGKLCAGLKGNKAISHQVDKILKYLRSDFTAVHWRMFQCKDYEIRARKLEEYLVQNLPYRSIIYLVSAISKVIFRTLSKHFTVVTKNDVTPGIDSLYPFSALALIDYEVSLKASKFFGMELLTSRTFHASTFSSFVVQMRFMRGMPSQQLPEDTFC
uniref:Uncharacterized protein n=1 Tax=Tetraselmis sp. GSL018 TaxID=582737 RepID=A0A061RBQ0_9CHLO|mmetsp:Transcript_39118/g.92674  ORF Transcript_39118/g.92674 Transcript_39118/m.92674 type:complete len:360 (-) Transcript_39118:1050-2129(-)